LIKLITIVNAKKKRGERKEKSSISVSLQSSSFRGFTYVLVRDPKKVKQKLKQSLKKKKEKKENQAVAL
jgi:hypothetical protein